MEAAKRSRQEAKNYNEVRNYRKKIKTSGGSLGKDSPVNALILDNGGYTMKIGYSSDSKPVNLPNCIMKAKSERKRVFVADQIEDCRDLSGLYYMYPHEKGYISKFDIQKNIWDYTFNKFPIYNNTVMLTQPIFNFRAIQEYTDEIFFEEYDVKSLFKANATDYCYYNYTKQFQVPRTSAIVVDSGFSFTHIVPYIKGKKYLKGTVRLKLGGKLLTNYLKDILSYRQLHVMEETYVINQVKEDLCFMSANFKADMRRARSTHEIVKNYVLPDFHNIRRGYIHDNPTAELAESCQILRLNNERITIPEVMMRPSIITGFEFAGIAECIEHAVRLCPKEFQGEMTKNIIFCGGNSLFPGFRDRLESETRMFLPCDYELNIHQPEDPLNYAWLGGKIMSDDPKFRKRCATKAEYEEEGSGRLYEKFNAFYEEDRDETENAKVDDEEFSYLNYWKNEGVDIFQKEPLLPVKDPEIQFKLEGENIEEYDGKFVTLDFEIERHEEESQKPATAAPESHALTMAEETARNLRRKRLLAVQAQQAGLKTSVVQAPTTVKVLPALSTVSSLTVPVTSVTTTVASRTLTTLTSLPSQLLTTRQIVTLNPQMLQGARVSTTQNVLNSSNIVLPKLTRIQPRVLTPVYKSLPAGVATSTGQQGKITQYISLGNNVNLSGLSVVSTAAGSVRAATPNILNNAVIVPQNMLTNKNLTFQIIPIKPGQGNIILTQTKTTQD